MKQHALKNVINCLNANIYSYLETSGGKSYYLYLNVVHFLTPVLIRHLWQLKTVVFLHWCLIICAVPLNKMINANSKYLLFKYTYVDLNKKRGNRFERPFPNVILIDLC